MITSDRLIAVKLDSLRTSPSTTTGLWRESIRKSPLSSSNSELYSVRKYWAPIESEGSRSKFSVLMMNSKKKSKKKEKKRTVSFWFGSSVKSKNVKNFLLHVILIESIQNLISQRLIESIVGVKRTHTLNAKRLKNCTKSHYQQIEHFDWVKWHLHCEKN